MINPFIRGAQVDLAIECDEEAAKANLALIEYLEELDDIDAVYHNMN